MELVVWSRPSPHEWTSNLMILQYHQCLITLFWVMSEDGKKLSVGCCDVVIKRFSIFRLLLCFDLSTIVIGKVASNRKRISAYRHTPWVNRAQLICVNRRATQDGYLPSVRPSWADWFFLTVFCTVQYSTYLHDSYLLHIIIPFGFWLVQMQPLHDFRTMTMVQECILEDY